MLDTGIVSHLMKGDPMAEMCKPLIQGQPPSTSFITVGELY